MAFAVLVFLVLIETKTLRPELLERRPAAGAVVAQALVFTKESQFRRRQRKGKKEVLML